LSEKATSRILTVMNRDTTPSKNAGASPAASRLPSGHRLGGYELRTLLGSGAMADVYLGLQTSLGRKVAVKVLREPGRGYRDTSVERFMQEARAAASLVHGNIVQIYEVGCVDDVHFIAEEYVAGPTLKQWLHERGTLSPPQAVSVLEQVAAALDRAWKQKIVHRDIKPENLLITPAGEVKVADFGLARVTLSGEGLDLTHEGTTLGTPLYMSPEQVEGRELDSRSDLYSLGATLFHLIAGRPPFETGSPLSVALAHVRETPRPLRQLRPEFPAILTELIDRLLAKDPADRYADPAALLEALQATEEVAGGAGRSIMASLAWQGDGSPGWSPGHAAATAESSQELRAATSQLEQAMLAAHASRVSHRRFWIGVAVASAAAFAVGGALGRIRTTRQRLKATSADGR
jgi:serine/threonine protein kinase